MVDDFQPKQRPFYDFVRVEIDNVHYDMTNMMREAADAFHAKLERVCKEDFDTLARANGYLKSGEEKMAIVDAIVYALAGCTDFEGNPPSEINYLQCVRRLNQYGNGYVKLDPGQLVVNEDLCDYCAANEYNKAINYIRLQPGQVVVDGREHDLAMCMAAKWAEYVSQRDQEARDEA